MVSVLLIFPSMLVSPREISFPCQTDRDPNEIKTPKTS